jgi:NAD(P)-dependent dehydrogenase (short-subunit alcohol dehydrogenase family)
MSARPDSNFTKFDLNGQWALITGGAGLLGAEHAIALLQIGANVVLWDINSEKLESVLATLKRGFPNQNIIGMCVDITIEKAVVEAQVELYKQNVHVSILINNAAINPKYDTTNENGNYSRVENLKIDDWDFQLRVGLTGAFICSKVFGNLMAQMNYGVIVNIASDLSVISPDQRLYEKMGLSRNAQSVKPITYSVIKTGLIGMTRYLATYWCESGVRVNALSPGGVYENQGEDFIQDLKARIPLGRMANKDEYHSAIQFLCSSASSYMTGHNLIVDGGRTIW